LIRAAEVAAHMSVHGMQGGTACGWSIGRRALSATHVSVATAKPRLRGLMTGWRIGSGGLGDVIGPEDLLWAYEAPGFDFPSSYPGPSPP
jgi:hypothetical protein